MALPGVASQNAIEYAGMKAATMSAENSGPARLPRPARLHAYELVAAIVSDDHNFESGIAAARELTERVLEESGPAAVTELAVELANKVAEALERFAAAYEVPVADLADVWFLE
jgi:hypothetical protein